MSTPEYEDHPSTPQVTPAPVQEQAPEATPAPDAAAEEKAPAYKTVKRAPQNVVLPAGVFTKLVDGIIRGQERLALPSDFPEDVAARLEQAPNVRLDATDEQRNWARVFRDGLLLVPLDQTYRSTLEDPSAAFVPEIDSPEGPLAPRVPMYRPSGENLSGERGMLQFMQHMGMGTVFRVPLWNTGIWLNIKAPGEARLLELHREMINDQIQLGRTTYGMALSNQIVYQVDRIMQVVMEMIYSATLDHMNTPLLDVISVHDIDAVIWGLACSIWNNGIQYERGCTHNPEVCNTVVAEKLNLTKLLWVNKHALTQRQILHMAKSRQNAHTLEEVKKYKDELVRSQNRSILLNKGQPNEARIVLRVPVVSEYIDAGHEWVGSIVAMVNGVLGVDSSPTERNKYIAQKGRASSMRQYLHWVHSIHFTGEDGAGAYTIDDRETLADAFEKMSSIDNLREPFLEEVRKFINDSAITIIGVPAYTCPNCGNDHQKDVVTTAAGNAVIPMDVLQTFFILLVQRATLIGTR